MVEGVESVGEAVTGGMLAGAVEPRAGGAAAHARGEHGQNCLNCGTALAGEYCHSCGQTAHVHRTLGAFWHDIAHSVFHFEGKFWRTLPLLVWHPGELTRRYVDGERARFVSPMALFLFSVFLMFAVISAFGGPFDTSSAGSTTPAQDRAEAAQEYREERARSEAELKELTEQLKRARAAGQPTRGIEQEIKEVQLELRLQRDAYALATRLANEEEAREAQQESQQKEREAKAKAEDARAKSEVSVAKIDPVTATTTSVAVDTSDAISFGQTGIPPIDAALKKANDNPALVLYKLQTNAYKFSWALIPISVPFVWMLFLHRRRYWKYKAYDHVVFVTYSIAFMSLGYIVLTLLRPLGASEAIAGVAIAFVPPIHMYRQLRGAYHLSRFSALWRTFLLIIFAFVAAGLFLSLLMGLGVFG